MNKPFSIDFQVRDYELDLQGIVNNSNYQQYLEHARHEYLFGKKIDFAKLHSEGIDLVVTRIEMDYKTPLQSRDEFYVTIVPKRDGMLKIVFEQNIYRKSDNKPVVLAKVTGICLKSGRPVKPESVIDLAELGILE
jgi:acyl-CoA thioester hydrolase